MRQLGLIFDWRQGVIARRIFTLGLVWIGFSSFAIAEPTVYFCNTVQSADLDEKGVHQSELFEDVKFKMLVNLKDSEVTFAGDLEFSIIADGKTKFVHPQPDISSKDAFIAHADEPAKTISFYKNKLTYAVLSEYDDVAYILGIIAECDSFD